jgi:hypothetical protein
VIFALVITTIATPFHTGPADRRVQAAPGLA